MSGRFAKQEHSVNQKVSKLRNAQSRCFCDTLAMDRIGRKRPYWFIKEWREHRDWTQEQLADRSNMTKGMISQFETGKKRLHDDHVGALAFAFGIEPTDLLRDPRAPTQTDLLRGTNAEEQKEIIQFIDFIRARKAG